MLFFLSCSYMPESIRPTTFLEKPPKGESFSVEIVASPVPESGLIYNDAILQCVSSYDLLESDSVDIKSVEPIYTWSVGETGAFLQLNSTFQPTQEIYCSVRYQQGNEISEEVLSDTIEIANRPPIITNIAISSDSGNNTNNSTLTCEANVLDSDGSELEIQYSWKFPDGNEIQDQSVLLEYIEVGEDVTCTVTAEDPHENGKSTSEKSITIENSPPQINEIVLAPSTITTQDTVITCIPDHSDPDFENSVIGENITITYQWYINDELIETTIPTLQQKLQVGDSVTCEVTLDDYTTTTTGSVNTTVINTPPTVEIVDNLSEGGGTFYTNDIIEINVLKSDIDVEQQENLFVQSYEWFVTSQTEGTTTSVIAENTLDGHLHFDKNDLVSVTVQVSDGVDITTATSETFSISNSLPYIESASYVNHSITTEDDISLDVLSIDDDMDVINTDFEWFVDNISVLTTQTPNLTSNYYEKGQSIFSKIIPHDDEETGEMYLTEEILVQNSPPQITEMFIEGEPYNTSTLSCEVTASDLDSVDILDYTYLWSTGETSQTIALDQNVSSNEQLSCTVSVSDGDDEDTSVATLILQNRPPQITSVNFTQTDIYSNDTLELHIVAVDPDNDVISYSVDWFVNGILTLENGNRYLDGAQYFSKHDVISYTVTPSDGTDIGSTYSSTESLTIPNSPPEYSAIEITESESNLSCHIIDLIDADSDNLLLSYTWEHNNTPTSYSNESIEGIIVPGFWKCNVNIEDGETSVTASTEYEKEPHPNDFDADGYIEDDCDNFDPTIGNTADDSDCDGFLINEDCDDNNPYVYSSEDDIDCDGLEDIYDWDDEDGIPLHHDYSSNGFVTERLSTYDTTCSVDMMGKVKCWGSNHYGEAIPPSDITFSEVSVGQYHACGIMNDGQIACWGQGLEYYISFFSSIYGQLLHPINDRNYVSISAGRNFTCALDDLGSITCWGQESYNLLSDVPIGSFTQISSGDYHACALDMQGSITCWGNDSNDVVSNVPSGNFVQVSAGGSHTCALDDEGSIVCWGNDSNAVLSDIPTGSFIQVSAGSSHNCALDESGSITCWGSNIHNKSTPPIGRFIQVSSGLQNSCAIDLLGHIHCWGKYVDNFAIEQPTCITPIGFISTDFDCDGVLSSNDCDDANPRASTFDQDNDCDGVLSSNDCDDNAPEIGDIFYDEDCDGLLDKYCYEVEGLINSRIYDTDTGNISYAQDENVSTFCAIGKKVQFNHTYIFGEDGSDYFEIKTDDGLLLQSGEVRSGVLYTDFLDLDCNNQLSNDDDCDGTLNTNDCDRENPNATTTDNDQDCDGLDDDLDIESVNGYVLHQNFISNANEPFIDVQYISAGERSTCIITNLSTVQCWGNDDDGLVSQRPTGEGYVEVSGGSHHTCALRSDGSIDCWGRDIEFQIRETPSASNFTKVRSGRYFNCALDDLGSITCWGQDLTGVISDAPLGNGYSQLSTGNTVACALNSIGEVECWGDEDFIQTPTGSFRTISVGNIVACAIDNNGQIQCWGNNDYKLTSNIPSGSFVDIKLKYNSACALDIYGKVTCWGEITEGQQLTISNKSVVHFDMGKTYVCILDASGGFDCLYDTTELSSQFPECVQIFGFDYADQDCDGYEDIEDCDDTNPMVHSSINDEDCDGYLTDEDCDDTNPQKPIMDEDCDGYLTDEDCDDTNPMVFVGSAELESTTDCMKDSDNDGYGDNSEEQYYCVGVELFDNNGDGWDNSSLSYNGTFYTLSEEDDCYDENLCQLSHNYKKYYWCNSEKIDIFYYAHYESDENAIRITDMDGNIYTYGWLSDEVLDMNQMLYTKTVNVYINGNDCDDNDPQTVNDMDCDGYLTNDDCDDTNPFAADTNGDADCDGIPSIIDSDDTNGIPIHNSYDSNGNIYRTYISNNYQTTCLLDKNSSIVCWGRNTILSSNHPSGSGYIDLSLGWGTGCVIDENEEIQCWGDDTHSVISDIPSGSFTDIQNGDVHACAIQASDKSVVCWGNDSFQQTSSVPTDSFQSIDSGFLHTCGLTLDDEIRCWGAGESADNCSMSLFSSDCGQSINPLGTYKDVTTGARHSCALSMNGEILCWGDALGVREEDIPTGSFIDIDAGNNNTCAIKSDGTIVCWGEMGYLELSNLKRAVAIEVGFDNICYASFDGSIECFGQPVGNHEFLYSDYISQPSCLQAYGFSYDDAFDCGG